MRCSESQCYVNEGTLTPQICMDFGVGRVRSVGPHFWPGTRARQINITRGVKSSWARAIVGPVGELQRRSSVSSSAMAVANSLLPISTRSSILRKAVSTVV